MVSRADRERLCTLDPAAAKRVKVMCINQKKKGSILITNYTHGSNNAIHAVPCQPPSEIMPSFSAIAA